MLIVGGGPAGLTAAVYAARAGLSVLVLGGVPGGQVATASIVENYPGFLSIFGADLAEKLLEHARSAGAEVRMEEAKQFLLDGPVKTVRTPENEYRSKTVILAQGSHRKKLGIPGEEKFAGHGVSWCATCDGNFFRGKTTAVVGGGNTAVGDAITLSRLCKTVYLLHRRDRLKAEYSLVKRAEALDNLKMIFKVVPERIEGETKVERIVVRREGGGETVLPVDGVFIAIGVEPNSGGLPLSLKADGGYVEAPESCVTAVPGVFVAGDLRKKPLFQIVTAVSDGANAAVSAERFLTSGRS